MMRVKQGDSGQRSKPAGSINCNRVYCIHVPGHDPITFFFPILFLFDWVGFLWPNYLRC